MEHSASRSSLSLEQIFPMNTNAVVDTLLCEMKGVSFHYNDLAWGLGGVSGEGWHTQLGSGYLGCTWAFPASPQQPCGKTLKRETASRMKTVIMQSLVYYSAPCFWVCAWVRGGGTLFRLCIQNSLVWWCCNVVLYGNNTGENPSLSRLYHNWSASHAAVIDKKHQCYPRLYTEVVCDMEAGSSLQGGAAGGSLGVCLIRQSS